MPSKAVKDEAEKLVRDHGAAAYSIAREAVRLARRRKNERLSSFFGKVALEVARQQKREQGLEAEPRHLDN